MPAINSICWVFVNLDSHLCLMFYCWFFLSFSPLVLLCVSVSNFLLLLLRLSHAEILPKIVFCEAYRVSICMSFGAVTWHELCLTFCRYLQLYLNYTHIRLVVKTLSLTLLLLLRMRLLLMLSLFVATVTRLAVVFFSAFLHIAFNLRTYKSLYFTWHSHTAQSTVYTARSEISQFQQLSLGETNIIPTFRYALKTWPLRNWTSYIRLYGNAASHIHSFFFSYIFFSGAAAAAAVATWLNYSLTIYMMKKKKTATHMKNECIHF